MPPSTIVAAAEGVGKGQDSKVKDSLGKEIDLRALPRGLKKKNGRRAKQEDALAAMVKEERELPSLDQSLDKLQLSVSDLGMVDPELRQKEAVHGEGGLVEVEDTEEATTETALRIGDLEVVNSQGLSHGLMEPMGSEKTR